MPGYACPHCRKSFTAPASTAAAQVRCPHCKKPVEVPATAASRWFVARNKKKFGPYTWQQLQTLAKRGDVNPDDLLRQEGARKWQRAGTVRNLFSAAALAAKPPVVTTSTAAPPKAKARGSLVMLLVALALGG